MAPSVDHGWPPVDNVLALARAILIRAFRDLRKAEDREEVFRWLYSDQAAQLMEAVGLDARPQAIAEAIERALQGRRLMAK